MITRSEDFSVLDQQSLNKLANIINNQSKMVDLVDDKSKAVKMQKELELQGFSAEVIPHGSKYKVTAKQKERIDLRKAQESGMFKKLAWGRYCFERESRLGAFSYDFDDGSIWKVVKGEDGNEYLIKEVDDNDKEVIRTKVASNDISINDDNYKTAMKLAFNNENELKEGSISHYLIAIGAKDKLYKAIEAKLDDTISSQIVNNHYIQSKDYNNYIKEAVYDAINKDQLKDLDGLKNLIAKCTEIMVTKKSNINNLF